MSWRYYDVEVLIDKGQRDEKTPSSCVPGELVRAKRGDLPENYISKM
jgi:hypothetical protein